MGHGTGIAFSLSSSSVVPTVEHVARYPNSHFWDAARSPTADHIKDVMVPTIHPPIFTSFSQANSQRLEMGIIISCLVGIVTCLGECVMGIIGAIVDCLECVISAIIGLFTGIVDCICDCLCCGRPEHAVG
ncbi:hypothetical protein BGY98DRAFT_987111 [Russula aff. rugulosa BPL654]|nr:hypothetical protein BGY98DRAFT_987111 [Russula aff. rugulosa BPL654]